MSSATRRSVRSVSTRPSSASVASVAVAEDELLNPPVETRTSAGLTRSPSRSIASRPSSPVRGTSRTAADFYDDDGNIVEVEEIEPLRETTPVSVIRSTSPIVSVSPLRETMPISSAPVSVKRSRATVTPLREPSAIASAVATAITGKAANADDIDIITSIRKSGSNPVDVVETEGKSYVMALTPGGQPFYVETNEDIGEEMRIAQYSRSSKSVSSRMSQMIENSRRTSSKSTIVGHCTQTDGTFCRSTTAGTVSHFTVVKGGVEEGYGRLSGSVLPIPIVSQDELESNPAKVYQEVAKETDEIVQLSKQEVVDKLSELTAQVGALKKQLHEIKKGILPYLEKLEVVVQDAAIESAKLATVPQFPPIVAKMQSLHERGTLASFNIGSVLTDLASIGNATAKVAEANTVLSSIIESVSEL